MEELPPAARAELVRLVRPLDEEFMRKTLPNPFADRGTWRTEYWWYRRLALPQYG
ncbi:hypothetical protein ACFVH6_35360 [Spirillospora sp. NPDC127200]